MALSGPRNGGFVAASHSRRLRRFVRFLRPLQPGRPVGTRTRVTTSRKSIGMAVVGTGEGQLTPAGITGSVTSSAGPNFPKPVANVSVTIGGVAAAIQYAGEAPGLVSGVIQVNAVIPPGVTSGNLPVVLTIGNNSSPANVTVAVQ